MRRRLLELAGVTVAFGALTVLLQAAPMGQQTGDEPRPEAEAAAPTPWGEPDLQGIWTTSSETPLQRPARYADKAFFTEEERAELDRVRSESIARNEGRTFQTVGGYDAAVFLSHKRTGRRTSLIVDPPDGRIPPFTPEAEQRQAAIREYHLALLQATDVCRNNLPTCEGGTYGPPSPRRAEPPPFYPVAAINRADHPEDRGLNERCMSARLPDYGASGGAGFFLRVVQSPGAVAIFYDTGQGQGWQRTIPVTGRPHLAPRVQQWRGDSRARWEGETLVVDVSNFGPKTDFFGSRENLHLVERWTRLDTETLEYVVTIDDPTTWTRPWTVAVELSRQGDRENRIYQEPRCHEGNYGLPALLAGSRSEERAHAAGEGPDPATLCSAGCERFDYFRIGDPEPGETAEPGR